MEARRVVRGLVLRDELYWSDDVQLLPRHARLVTPRHVVHADRRNRAHVQ